MIKSQNLRDIIGRLSLVKEDREDLIKYIQGDAGVINYKENIINTTYLELKSLVDNNKLIPGMQYRIIDYITTTTQANTKSAGHQFDIIVTANNNNTLNKEARAIQHEGDTYFTNSNLNAWKIWYCINNNTERFKWADTKNGKGIIYRMIDEWNNDVPYDFKNIQFYKKWDENNQSWVDASEYDTRIPCYTFSSNGNSSTIEFTDYSLTGTNVYCNVIKEYKNNNILKLNNICFFGTCYNNYFENYCRNNSFGDNCINNFFGNQSYNNSFLNDCRNNYFGNYFVNNHFGSNCWYNYFGNSCFGNYFGNNCRNNSFKNNFNSNHIGTQFRNNFFGNNCYANYFGDYCYNNHFGNDCAYIKFALESSVSITHNYYRNNYFSDGCQFIIFKGTETASPSVQIQNYKFAQGLQGTLGAYLTIDGVRNNSYETKVAKNSNGEIKQYCEADLIL